MAVEELLGRATALAKSNRNMDIMDRTTILHGYLELTRLDPENGTYQKNLEDAAALLVQAAQEYQAWQVHEEAGGSKSAGRCLLQFQSQDPTSEEELPRDR